MTGAPGVDRIANVTAFVGSSFEPRRVDVEIAGGSIAAIVQPGSPGIDGTTIDGSDLFAFPGMVDAHDHLRTLTPGLAGTQGLSLDDFLRVMWASGAAMGPEEYRIGALLGSVQRLRAGITTVVDHCYTFHAAGLDEASIEGYRAAGTRWVYARGIMTRPYEPVCETWDVAEAKIRRLVGDGVVAADRLFVAPVSIRQARPEEFTSARRLADELGVGLYTHVAETADEVSAWVRETGASPIAALDALGFLTDRTILIHCVHLTGEEIDRLAERGTHVVHCPTNNMKLAKGFTPVPDLLAAGVNVALGVDMMLDLLSEMRTEIGMQAAYRLDPNAVGKLEALRMATWNGARALGWGSHIGLLETGRRADVVLLEARSILQAPLLDPAYALIYATDPSMVRHVLVDGRWVVRDGRSTLVDEGALVQEAESIASSYLERIGAGQRPWFRR